MKQVEVTILGQGYLLACPDGGEEQLASAVAAVDREMSAIRDAGKIRARERIAVLAALNLAYQLAQQAESAARSQPGSPSQSPASGLDSSLQAIVARLDAALEVDGHLI